MDAEILTNGIFYAKAAACIGAAIAMGIGSLGPSIGQGLVGMKGCDTIGRFPKESGTVRTTMFIAMGIIESSAIYCLLIAGALIYFAIYLK